MKFLSKIFMIISFILSFGLLVSCGSNSLNGNNNASVLDKITLATTDGAEIHAIPIDESEIKDPETIEPAEAIDCSEFNLTLRTEVRSCLISLIENNILTVPGVTVEEAIASLVERGASSEISTTVVANNLILLGITSQMPRTELQFADYCRNSLNGKVQEWFHLDGALSSVECIYQLNEETCTFLWYPDGRETDVSCR